MRDSLGVGVGTRHSIHGENKEARRPNQRVISDVYHGQYMVRTNNPKKNQLKQE